MWFFLLIVLPALALSVVGGWTTLTEIGDSDRRHGMKTSVKERYVLTLTMLMISPFVLLEPWFCVLTGRKVDT